MPEKEYFIDDRVIIPDSIKRMSDDELRAEISRLEAEAAAEKKHIIERLQGGEAIKCKDCHKGHYITNAIDKSISHEFHCDHCGSVLRVTPNIIVE